MNIIWYMGGKIEQTDQGLTSKLASARYRALSPARELALRGHVSHFFHAPSGQSYGKMHDLDIPDWDRILALAPGVNVVFGKVLNPRNEALAAGIQGVGGKVVMDVCDNHFLTPGIAEHYHRMAALADKIVANTPAMAEAIKAHTGRDAYVVPDPYEGVRCLPRFDPAGVLRLLWFGHPVSLNGLLRNTAQLHAAARLMPLELHVVTALSQPVSDAITSLAKAMPFGATMRFTRWSPEAMVSALADCDAVYLPLAPLERNTAKSPNRLVESLWAGRLAFAHPIPAYQPFAQWAWVDPDLGQGLAWALAERDAIPGKIALAQDYIAQHHSPQHIADLWERVLEA